MTIGWSSSPVRMSSPIRTTSQNQRWIVETLGPALVRAEDFGSNGEPTLEALRRGPLPRFDRARQFIKQFTFQIAPGSLLAASEIQRKLLYLQLSRAGLIDHWTLMEVLGI